MTLNRGELIGILGPNGAGKSSLLKAMAGDLKPELGHILLDEQAVFTQTSIQLAKKRAYLPQNPEYAFNMTVRQLLELGLYAFKNIGYESALGFYQQVLSQTATDESLLDRPLVQLSGGQLQRVHMARVLVQLQAMLHEQTCGWLLIDEPLSSLDPLHQQHLLALCQRLVRETNVGVVIVLHDLNLAAQWCDRLILLADQHVLVDAAPIEALTSQNLFQAFGVRFDVFERQVDCVKRLVALPNALINKVI